MIRVELHEADSEDYDVLHEAMSDEGFLKEIQDDDTKIWYELPPAQYHFKSDSDLDRNTVLNKSKRAAKKTMKKYGITVTTSNGSVWTGLDEVD